ncbi:MAG: aspartate aminotransferase family protein [Oscillospiraceae bacterium]|nr:aspartate aminotransferase family protein [Oscillospiraceae bacterium]
MTNQELIKDYDQYVMGTYGRFPIALSHGSGATLYDFDGKQYIDFASGVGVNSLGCAHPAWVRAITEQAMRIGHTSNLYYSEPAMRVAKALCERTGMDQAFFANSGAESNEGLIKLARKYSRDKYGAGRSKVVTLVQSFHGRTVTTLSATGQEVFQQHFFPFTEGFVHVPAGDLDALVAAASGGDTAAVLLELIQGEGGVLPMDPAYIQQVAAFCAERDILLLLDEVQTGIGRTGSLFAFEQYGITPDAVSFAKGIAGGLPFGGFLASEKCSRVLGPGQHATTFGGNPIAAAAASVVLETLTEAELEEVVRKGQYIQEKVLAMDSPYVSEVRGLGLMIGVVLKDIGHKDLAKQLNEDGLLALTAGTETLRFLPPLTISYAEIDKGLGILARRLVV